jgi:hypothetical protein
MLNDVAAEALRESQVDRHLKDGAALGEVLVDLPGNAVQPCRRAGTRGLILSASGQHSVVAFDSVGDPDQIRLW